MNDKFLLSLRLLEDYKLNLESYKIIEHRDFNIIQVNGSGKSLAFNINFYNDRLINFDMNNYLNYLNALES
jgi:hypothetical protein